MAVPESHWVKDMFDAGDSLDIARAMSFLTDDVVMRVCNEAPAQGIVAARTSFEELVKNLVKVNHEILNIYDVNEELTITETFVEYTLKDGRTVTNYSCNHLRHRNGRVFDNRIFMDPTGFQSPNGTQ